MQVGDWISIGSLVLVIIGLVIGLFEWRHSNKVKRSELVNNLLDKLSEGSALLETFYLIEYDKFKYDESFHNSEIEKKIDNLLFYFNYICYLKHEKILFQKDFGSFEYKISRVLTSRHIQYYLWNIYHFSMKFNKPNSFACLINFALENNYFPEGTNFFDNEDPHFSRRRFLNI